MLRAATLALLLASATMQAQQIALDWATPTAPSITRVKTAPSGGCFSLGIGATGAVLQRFSSGGVLLWTRTLGAPVVFVLDLDVDGANNAYILLSLVSGQLDLDPGPGTTLVNPGRVCAKYNGNGQLEWGFSLENVTSNSEDYAAISVDDSGNLYVCGDMNSGTSDFDPGPGVNNLVVPPNSGGAFVARYRADGTLAFANLRTWPGGNGTCYDIAVMPNGSAFYVVQTLDDGGPLGSQVDVDPGPGVYNVFTDSKHVLRYDSLFNFQGHAYVTNGDLRMRAADDGALYMLAGPQAGFGVFASKFAGAGPALTQVYNTTLSNIGNMVLGDVAPDGQGGFLGMYTASCQNDRVYFFKMNVSGLPDFNGLPLTTSSTDCSLPRAKGFDLDGSTFYIGTVNQNYPIDFDPGPGLLELPTNNDDGVVARFDWCGGAPFDPIAINAVTQLCVGDTAIFAVDAFGDADGYAWTVSTGWDLLAGQGTDTITVALNGQVQGLVQVAATNSCGTSGTVSAPLTAGSAEVNAGPDVVICIGATTLLTATSPAADGHLWTPGNATTSFFEVAPTVTTLYTVTVENDGCLANDEVLVTVDPCLAIGEQAGTGVALWPVPVEAGTPLRVSGLPANAAVQVLTADGRLCPVGRTAVADALLLDTRDLATGSYVLRAPDGRSWPFLVVR